MSVVRLQEKIRKMKNPSVIHFTICKEQLPPHIMEEETDFIQGSHRFYRELLTALKDVVPAVRFSFGDFALFGPEGLALLENTLSFAKQQGYYIFLDAPEALSPQAAQNRAEVFFAEDSPWTFDALVVCAYIGSDGLLPYAEKMKNCDKALFSVVRTANRTAPELQDLLSGSRLVHVAATDVANRLAQKYAPNGRYSDIGIMAGASSAHSLRTLRDKYKNLFLLLDGFDYANSNAKNCSEAFDELGHGAVACAGASVTAAFLTEETDPAEYISAAVFAAERMKKNLSRYIKIL